MTYRPNYYGDTATMTHGAFRNMTIPMLPDNYAMIDALGRKHNISRGKIGRLIIDHVLKDERLCHHILAGQK